MSPDLVSLTLITTSPILLVALGGLLATRAGVFNIGLEGAMLVGAFAAIAGAHTTGSVWVGVFAAASAGLALTAVFAVGILWLRADQIICGLAINATAVGLTTTLLDRWFGTSGFFTSDRVAGLPRVLPWGIDSSSVVGRALSGLSPLAYLAVVLVVVVAWVLVRTPWGLAIRSVGEHPAAAESAGIGLRRTKASALAGCGVLCGLGGAQLAMGVLNNTFSANMTQGRGYLAFTAVIIGIARPKWVLAGSLLLGGSSAIGVFVQLRQIPVPAEFVLMIPFLLTIAVLTVVSAARHRKRGGELIVDELAVSQARQ